MACCSCRGRDQLHTKPNIEFLGFVSDEKLAELYANAKACVFPQEEDFGIVPLESMASGRPVIAYRGGGAGETIIENATGMFFDEQSEESLIGAVKNFKSSDFNPAVCRARAQEFDVTVFKEKIQKLLIADC